MRYIHDGELRDETIDPPPVFVFDEAAEIGTGKTDKALEPVFETSRHRSRSATENEDTDR